MKPAIPAEFQEAFEEYDRETTIRKTRLGSLLGIVLVPLFNFLDHFAYRDKQWKYLVVRLVCAGVMASIYPILGSNFGRKYYRAQGVLILLAPSATIAWMLHDTEGAASPYYAGLILVLMVLGVVLDWTFWQSVACVVLVWLLFLAACLPTLTPAQGGAFINNLFFLVSIGVTIMVGAYYHSHVRIREFITRCQIDKSHKAVEATNNKLSEQNLALERANREIKETEMQLVQSEKMSSLGRFSAGLMHDILNPLNYARTGLFVLRKKIRTLPPEAQPEADAIINDIEDGLRRVDNIVSDLRTFTHPGGQEAEELSLEDVFNISLRFVSSELKDRRISLKLNLAPGQKVWLGRNHFILVLVNVLENAIDALGEKQFPPGEEPRIEITGLRAGERCVLSIRDNGPGIAPQNLAKIFDPFFTTKEIGKGTGLGLSICFGILRSCGGTISAASEPGQYCEFTLDLPATAGAAALTQPEHAESLRL
jgi:two-component system sensor histidine kinase PhcS